MREAKSAAGGGEGGGSSWVAGEVEEVGDGETVRGSMRGRVVLFRIPPDYREEGEWDMAEKEEAPEAEFDAEWVYGYRGRDASDNLHNLPTGEVAYYIAAVAVLYNPEAQTQRYFRGHTQGGGGSDRCLKSYEYTVALRSHT